MKNTRALVISSDGIWAATEGGAYFFNPADNNFKTFNKVDGLNGTSLTGISIDNQDKLWFGSENGLIDVYDPAANSFKSILDILNSDKTSKRINDIKVSGDTISIATDFGISLINSKSLVFIDTYFKFGNFSSNTKVNSILVTNLIHAATESGIAIQKSGATNLSAPESWNVYDQTNGLPSKIINRLTFYRDTLIAGTDKGLSIFNGISWQSFLPQLNNKNILDISTDGGRLFILTENIVYLFDGLSLIEYLQVPSANRFSFDASLGLAVATKKGMFFNNTLIFPNGPGANQFPDITVDNSRNLWSSSGKDVTGIGIYKFNGNDWTIFDNQQYSQFKSNAFYRIYAAPDNTIYAGNWGNGFVRIRENDITAFDAANTGLEGIPQNPNFVVITGFGEDSKKNLWVLNFWTVDKNTLSVLTPDSTWHFFNIPAEQNRILVHHDNLVIDQSGTKWFNSTDEARSGLFYFNENKTLDNPLDDLSGYITTSSGLSSSSISDLAIDRRGDLWVGTNLGVNIISNLSSVLSSSNPQLRISSVFSIRQQTITAIAVDPLNRKWIGSNQGLFLLSSDGAQLLAALDSKNSPLLADKIESIAIDEKTGRVFVGTEAGLISFDTPAILPAESFNGLNIYPSPFVIKDGSQLITIDGLIRDSDIKILSISGKLVREFSSPGGRTAIWDGRDNEGELVSSGVYIVVAFDRDGNSVETGKVAVLRE
jgi:ligand-binding sensor domain-containing protein